MNSELEKAIAILENQLYSLKQTLKEYGDYPLDKGELQEYELHNKKVMELNKLIIKLKKL